MICIKFFVTVALLSGALWAQFPNQEMDRKTLGVKASLGFRGQNITEANVPSHETLPFVYLAYAPIEYVVLNTGLGFDRLTVEENNGVSFEGKYGFSPSLGVTGISPFFVNRILRVTAGLNFQYMSSRDDVGYRYHGSVFNPFAGLVVSPSQFVDIELGAKGHFIDGNTVIPNSPASPFFANQEILRGYISLTLVSPLERVFLHTAFDASPEIGNDWTHGPPEAHFSVSVGMLLGWKERKKPLKKGPIYFPDFPELRETSEEMKNEEE